MANKKNLLGILAIALVFGMTVAGCDDGTTSDGFVGLDGTWYSFGNVHKYYFSNGNYEYTNNGNPYRKGSYTVTSDSMLMTITHIGSSYLSSYTMLGSSTWYSSYDLRSAYLNYYRTQYRDQLNAQYGSDTINSKVEEYRNQITAIYGSYYSTSQINTLVENYKAQLIASYPTAGQIDTMVETYVAQYERSIDSTINSLYKDNTVAYSISGKTLILGGVSLTRN
jgi:hypothetical protein